jgi:hypothetical protein
MVRRISVGKSTGKHTGTTSKGSAASRQPSTSIKPGTGALPGNMAPAKSSPTPSSGGSK